MAGWPPFLAVYDAAVSDKSATAMCGAVSTDVQFRNFSIPTLDSRFPTPLSRFLGGLFSVISGSYTLPPSSEVESSFATS